MVLKVVKISIKNIYFVVLLGYWHLVIDTFILYLILYTYVILDCCSFSVSVILEQSGATISLKFYLTLRTHAMCFDEK